MKSFFFILAFVMSAKTLAKCPHADKKETKSDCPWAEITRKIVDQKQSCEKILKSDSPQVLTQLQNDRKSSDFLQLWGTAKNFDENAKSEIVDLKILKCLAAQVGVTDSIEDHPGFSTVHAGVQHTYAYLFSNLLTPYGYKRARWTSGELQAGFGLKPVQLTPKNRGGAFLANVTYFFAKFAFNADHELLKKLETSARKKNLVSAELLNFNYHKFEIKNLSETPVGKNVVLHTTFVKMNPKNLKGKNTHLLIYWVENNSAKYFISGFPVEQSFVDKAFDEKNLGPDKPIATRYNAWVPGVTDSPTPLSGSRTSAAF